MKLIPSIIRLLRFKEILQLIKAKFKIINLSIIIVNYKSPHLIEQCIRSIVKHERDLSYEIIVVDNNLGMIQRLG